MKDLSSYFPALTMLLLAFSVMSCSSDSEAVQSSEEPEALIFGGGDYHDFDRWFN